jgi:hypothetical protein
MSHWFTYIVFKSLKSIIIVKTLKLCTQKLIAFSFR